MLDRLKRFVDRLNPGTRVTPLPQAAPPAAQPQTVMLRGGGTVNVVGEASYQKELLAICGRKTKDGANHSCVATLVPEPTNAFDKNAVAVYVDGRQVGYLSKADARAYGPVLAQLAESGQVASCDAVVNGGWKRGPDEEGHFGVVLGLAAPGECLPR